MNNIHKESIRLLRDVDAFVVPSGDEVKLLAGNLVQITQALGGNYTVFASSYTEDSQDLNHCRCVR